ncbi:MAG: hypothetical protein WBA11_15005, partial [Rubrivirga sp.]
LEDAVDDAVYDIDVPSSRRRLGLRVEAAVLRALPPDSTVRLGDIVGARTQIVPAVGGNMDLPEWVPRSSATERFARARSQQDQTEALVDLGRSAISHLPTSLFLLLPVFALLLKILYVRRGWYYSEHLVFGLHVHAVAFVALAAMVAVSAVTGGGGISSGGSPVGGVLVSVLGLYIPVYFLIAAKRVYGQGWIKTAVKSSVLGFWYLLAITVLGLFTTLLLTLVAR